MSRTREQVRPDDQSGYQHLIRASSLGIQTPLHYDTSFTSFETAHTHTKHNPHQNRTSKQPQRQDWHIGKRKESQVRRDTLTRQKSCTARLLRKEDKGQVITDLSREDFLKRNQNCVQLQPECKSYNRYTKFQDFLSLLLWQHHPSLYE